MKFDGMRWRRTRFVVTLPRELFKDDKENPSNYIRFGWVIKKGQLVPDSAIKTKSIWTDDKSPVYAMEIPNNGWSLTNMMYAKDETHQGNVYGRAYLYFKGHVYTTRWFKHTKKTNKYSKQELIRKYKRLIVEIEGKDPDNKTITYKVMKSAYQQFVDDLLMMEAD